MLKWSVRPRVRAFYNRTSFFTLFQFVWGPRRRIIWSRFVQAGCRSCRPISKQNLCKDWPKRLQGDEFSTHILTFYVFSYDETVISGKQIMTAAAETGNRDNRTTASISFVRCILYTHKTDSQTDTQTERQNNGYFSRSYGHATVLRYKPIITVSSGAACLTAVQAVQQELSSSWDGRPWPQ